MARIPAFLLRHEVTVEPYLGTWGQYGGAGTVRCFLSERLAAGDPAAGSERVAQLTVFAAPDAVIPAGSRITLTDGRAGYVTAMVRQDSGGLGAPDHVEAAVNIGHSYSPAYGETVILIRRVEAGQDRYHNTRYTVTEHTLTDVAVRPLSSSEDLSEQRDRVADTVEVILPPNTVVTALDRLQIRGLLYEIDGTPDTRYNAATGATPGVRVVARRITG